MMIKKLKLLASSFMIAFTLIIPQQLHAMEVESAEKMKVEPEENLVQMLNLLPKEVSTIILEMVVAVKIRDNNNLSKILLLCGETEDTNLKNFKNIILEGITGNQNWFAKDKLCWKAWHGVLGHEGTYNVIKNMVVIYRPDPNSDEGMIKLTIPADANPLDYTFDLSDKALFGDSGDHLCITVGYRKEKNPKNRNKFEIWISPRFLIEQHLSSSAKHYKPIMNKERWNEEIAPVGMIFNCAYWGEMYLYASLTNQNYDSISNNNCLKLYNTNHTHTPLHTRTTMTNLPLTPYSENFTFILNKNKEY